MRCALVICCFVFCVHNASAKVFDTRCKLARELIRVGVPSDIFLGQWVCLIEKESNRNTRAFVQTGSKKFYGLYQIPNRWCREKKKGGDCNIACESLLDDDIRDDTECAVQIFHREGFKYWPKWTSRCKNDNFITTEIYKCPDLKPRNDVLKSEALRRRRQQTKIAMERHSFVMNIFGVRQPEIAV